MSPANSPYAVAAETSSERVLAIDLPDATSGDATLKVRLEALDAALLSEHRPERVVFALFGPGQDAMAVIERLEALGYAGQITVICPSLPRPKLVEAELRAMGPGKRLSLLILPPADF